MALHSIMHLHYWRRHDPLEDLVTGVGVVHVPNFRMGTLVTLPS